MTDKGLSPALPRLAVVIPCYNAETWIDRALRSVLAQAYVNLVLIVVDDGSTDGSVDRIRTFGDQVNLLVGPNHGACHARNQGAGLAREAGATHVLFLDADDYLEGDMLAGAARIALSTGADMVLSDNHVEQPDGQREERFAYRGVSDPLSPVMVFREWMLGKYFNPSAILWRLDFVDALGGWDETLSRAQDTDFSLRALLRNPQIRKNDQGAAIYTRSNPDSISRVESPVHLESKLRVFSDLARRARGTPFEPVLPLLAGTLYSISRTAFRSGQVELGRRGVREMKALGFTDHPGTRLHAVLCRLIGLETKVKLWGR